MKKILITTMTIIIFTFNISARDIGIQFLLRQGDALDVKLDPPASIKTFKLQTEKNDIIKSVITVSDEITKKFPKITATAHTKDGHLQQPGPPLIYTPTGLRSKVTIYYKQDKPLPGSSWVNMAEGFVYPEGYQD